ncbi:MAG TPA: glycoside hydrolase family 28 protein [bacterium]|nr:glycoside hydrolase family 28 protein [bacterium]HQO33356.1 glycoside hydrolase family 28 protein [bacterium]HQP98729.1 glycoside hydrolase family 28 protein [bacterium]
MRIFPLFFLFFSAAFLCQGVPAAEISVRDLGAVGDGVALDTQAIQKAIDSMADAGGGRVLFPAGSYLSGTIYLRSHVTLELREGAVLLGSPRLEDYPVNFCKYRSYSDRYCVRALIWGEDLEEIAIVGRGMIDGQGGKFFKVQASDEELETLKKAMPDTARYVPHSAYVNRPYGIRLIGCQNVLVEGITLQNSPMWMQQYLHCNHVTLRDLRIVNHCNSNNDMIDIDSSRNVVVTGCYGDTDDDALTLKSTGPDPTENVTISNCILRSHVNAIKMGTESLGGFRNITISNCTILSSAVDRNHMAGNVPGYAGIALETVDGGPLERIAISNITMNGITTPIFMRLGDRGRTVTPDAPKPQAAVFRDVSIDNIVATGVGNIACSITGVPGHPIRGVSLSNIRIRCAGGVESVSDDLEVPEVAEKYPESTMFGALPAYGFYCRHVEDLTFRNVTVGYEEPDARYALVCDDVENLGLETFQAMPSSKNSTALILKDVRNALIRGCSPPEMNVFARLRGGCRNVTTFGNDFGRINTPISEE